MAQQALNSVLASISDARSHSNTLTIDLFNIATSLPKSATELRRIAIEVTTFSNVLHHFETILHSEDTARPTEALISVLVTVLKNANHVLQSIDEIVTAAALADHDNDVGPSEEYIDTVRPVLQSAQMTVCRLSLESLRLTLSLIAVILEWSSHAVVEAEGTGTGEQSETEMCAKCAVLSLRGSIMQLQTVEKISLNETTARRLSEERERAEETLRRIDRKPLEKRNSPPVRRGSKPEPMDPISAALEELIFGSTIDNSHSTQLWISQSAEHIILLRNWTGVDLQPTNIRTSIDVKTIPAVSVNAEQRKSVELPLQPRKLTLFAKIRTHSNSPKPERRSIVSVMK